MRGRGDTKKQKKKKQIPEEKVIEKRGESGQVVKNKQ